MAPSPHELNRQRHWVCALQITERRHQLGLTQRDVVERLDTLGIVATNRTLSAMEHGQGMDVGRLPELAIALQCTVTYLLGLTSDPSRWEPDSGALPAPEVTDTGAACTDPACWLQFPDGARSAAAVHTHSPATAQAPDGGNGNGKPPPARTPEPGGTRRGGSAPVREHAHRA